MLKRITDKFHRAYATLRSRARLANLARAVAAAEHAAHKPVVFFNASTRLGHLSQNAAFALLAAWGLRLEGVPILHFVCNAGMSRCVLGTDPDDAAQTPPCAACVAQSRRMYAGAQTHWFDYQPDAELRARVQSLGLQDLLAVEHGGLPLGQLVLPSLRWALRRHDLADDETTRILLREYILSANNVAREFDAFMDGKDVQAVVVFNGIMFPEAVARQIALRRGLRVITHEVGLQPLTAFFTDGEATAYPMDIPPDFQLGEQEDRRLDEYLSRRFKGDFSMAGIRFWQDIQALDADFLAKASQFDKLVPVFTNVIFDTSQVHANVLFEDMFAWLAYVEELIRANPRTLFVIRAHPDEMRPGSTKQSRQSVAEWVAARGLAAVSNVVFIPPTEYVDSYALIEKAHFVMVYNSSIGLEASIMGKAALCAGAARYTQYPTLYFPASLAEYKHQAEAFLAAAEVPQPDAFVREARRVLYFQLFKTSLPFDRYLQPTSMGYVNLQDFPLRALRAEHSPAIRAVRDGVVEHKPFLV
ncbi:MAG: hypothetical protein KF698_09405 [Anaerolineales bacterium]|nr:hypothetical protein [Anaerolineales bacterium]